MFRIFPPSFSLLAAAVCKMNEQYLAPVVIESSPDWHFHYVQAAYISSLNSKQNANTMTI